MKNLVIVESPTKANTLQRFLGEGYQIEASMGHIRDLPKSAFGVDVENNFEPQYVIPRDKRKRVNALKKVLGSSDTLWLATDPDREGEAISWHISQLASNGKERPKIQRVIFHEITPEAVKEAFAHPQEINLKLVDAQQARRVLDRLVGYKLSPLLWQKVKSGLSAGRVQSVALRLIVEREREIQVFKSEEYWTIEAEVKKASGNKNSFIATVAGFREKKLAIKNGDEAKKHEEVLRKESYLVGQINQREVRRFPHPPFTTSTLQQTSSNRLGLSAKKTMLLAQALYEHGLITYMRTDSINLAASAVAAARSYITQEIGAKYVPANPRIFKSKSKNIQEAHEAIRPTNVKLGGEDLKNIAGMTRDHVRLYDLIWKRFVACQMAEAVVDQTTVEVKAGEYLLRATGSVVKFEGWLKLYGKEAQDLSDEQSSRTSSTEQSEKTQVLPPLAENEKLVLDTLTPTQHFTQPPARYNEALLIKKLEELGIGRPSTYAPILSTIQERFYVERVERRFVPTPLGFAVTDFLIKYFPDIVDHTFTASMEDQLDDIARGERQWQPVIRQFFEPFEKKIEKTGIEAGRVKMEAEKTDKVCPECGKGLVVRFGKFGKFLACSGFPDCKHTEALEETINVKCPQDEGEIVVRKTRRGKTFYGCKNWPGCKFASWTKPKAVNNEQPLNDKTLTN